MISVLYVDDEQGLLELAQLFLEQSGEFTVKTSTTAQEVLDSGSIQSYDAIVSDYQMPEMDGIAFLKAVRERFGDIPFILFTGRGREEVVIDAINNGADFYLQKGGDPITQFAELAHKIRQAVRRRMAELERIRSEEKFSKLFIANPSLATIKDLMTDELIDVNEAFIHATGYTRDELIGKTTRDIGLYVDDRDRERITESVTHEGIILDFETRIRTKSGEIRTLDLTGQHIRVGDHDILFTQAVDITGRKRAEEELRAANEQLAASSEELRTQYNELAERERQIRESEEAITSIFRAAPVGIGLVVNRVIQRVNDRFSEISGYSGQEVIGRNARFLYPDDNEYNRVGEFYHTTTKSRAIDSIEIRWVRKDGTLRDILLFGTAVNPSSPTAGMFFTLLDITAEKKTREELKSAYEKIAAAEEELRSQYGELAANEQQIRESEERYRSVVDVLPGMICRFSPEGTITFTNETYRQFFLSRLGLTGIEGRNIHDIMQLMGDDGLDTVLCSLSPGAPVHEMEHEITGTNGEKSWQRWSIRAMFDKRGTPVEYQVVGQDIMEQKRAEAALQENQKRLRTVLDNLPDLVLVHRDGIILYVNPVLMNVIGRRPEDVLNNHVLDYIPPAYHARVADAIRQRTETGRGEPYEIEFLSRNGESRAVLIRGTGIDFDGKPAILTVLTDVTDSRRAEEALQQSEEKFRSFVENANDIIYTLTPDGVFTYITPNSADLIGYRPDEILGRSFEAITHPDDVSRCQTILSQAIATGKTRGGFEHRVRHKDGTFRWYTTNASIIHDRKGNVTSFLGIGRDITDRKRAEEALRESEEKFRSFVENANDIVFSLSLDGITTYVSPKWAELLGHDVSEIVGKPVRHIHPEDLPRVRELIDRVVSTGKKAGGIEYRVQHKNGTWQWHTQNISPLRDAEGRIVAIEGICHDITERKRMEEALRASEEKFRTMVETSSDVIWEVDVHGFYTYVSPKIRDMLGYDPGEVVGKKPFDLMPPDEAVRVAAEFSRFMEIRQPFAAIENVNIHKDGTTVILETSGVPRFAKEGTFAGYRGIDRNITARKQAELALRESETQYKRIFESFVDTYYETDKDGILRVISPSIYALTGWKPEELVGNSILNLYFDPADRTILLEQLMHVPAVFGFEVRLKKRDGSLVPISANARIRYTASGEPDGILGSIRDITEMVRARKALQESEEKYRHILENLQDAYVRTDKDGKLIMVSPSAVRMYGYSSAEEMIGLPANALYSDPSERQMMLRTLRERGGITDFNGKGLRKDGTTFWISLNVQFITGEDGRIEGTEGIVRDMTERRAMEQVIREVNKKLNLLSSITRHDVVNQLAVLQGYTQLAAKKNTDPVTADFLDKITAASCKIAGQIEFTKTYQDLGLQTPAWFRLDETIAKVSRDIVTVSATCNALEVYADPMIERVFFNLFDNAIRHGGHVTAIAIRCERAPDGLVIIVEDDGVGIEPDEKERIFEKGFGKNTGFGLFLAREILALTGITIRETGFLGIGARFEITVPKEMWRVAVV